MLQRLLAPALLCSIAFVIQACGSSNSTPTGSGGSTASGGTITLSGGATAGAGGNPQVTGGSPERQRGFLMPGDHFGGDPEGRERLADAVHKGGEHGVQVSKRRGFARGGAAEFEFGHVSSNR